MNAAKLKAEINELKKQVRNPDKSLNPDIYLKMLRLQAQLDKLEPRTYRTYQQIKETK